MHLYALSLLNASFLMVNSSWTKAHIDEVIALVGNSQDGNDKKTWPSRWFKIFWWIISRVLFLGVWIQVPPPQSLPSLTSSTSSSTQSSPSSQLSSPSPHPHKIETKIVYPPCDTNRLTSFPLGGRRRIIVSLAQFR